MISSEKKGACVLQPFFHKKILANEIGTLFKLHLECQASFVDTDTEQGRLIQPGTYARSGNRGYGAEAALAAPKFTDRAGEVFAVEVGPHPARKDQLRVSAFPEQEIAQAL